MKTNQISIFDTKNKSKFLSIRGPVGRILLEILEKDSQIFLGQSSNYFYDDILVGEDLTFSTLEDFNCWLRTIEFSKVDKKGKHPTSKQHRGWRKKQLLSFIDQSKLATEQGVSCSLLMVGIGYKAEKKDTHLILSVGRRHQVEIFIPDGIKIDIPKGNKDQKITIFGLELQKVINFGAHLRSLLPPEPYKGKGIRWEEESISLKEGKKK